MTGQSDTVNIKPAAADPYQEFITLLMTLENNIVLYPPGHDSITRVTEALKSQMEALFAQHKRLTLTAAREKLAVNGVPLTAGNFRNRKFALFLSQRGVVSVSMESGLTAQELVRFFEFLHQVPVKTDIHELPSLLESLNALPHIGAAFFDLKALRVQNQEQVQVPDETMPREDRWEKIIQSGIAGPENTEFIRSLRSLFPEFAASLQDRAAAGEDGTITADYEKLMEELQQNMTGEMVLAMGMHAISDEHRISPALQNLLSTLSHFKTDVSGAAPPFQQAGIGAEAIEKLFEREQYEKYVSPEYDAQLGTVSQQGGAGAVPGNMPGIEETELQEAQIGRRLARGLVELIGAPYGDDVQLESSAQLGAMLPEFLARQDYEFLCNLFDALKQLEAQEDTAAAMSARAVIRKYAGGAFMDRLMEDFEGATEEKQKALEDLIYISGPQNIPWLLALYNRTKEKELRKRSLRLLLLFKKATAETVLSRITAFDHKTVLQMLRLLTLCGGDPDDARLHPLLDAPEPEVYLEAARMCLSAGSSAPIPLLRGMLLSGDLDTAARAIRIAGEYKVAALSDSMARQLKTRFISVSAAFKNRLLLENLNKIGDKSVLPMLLKLSKTRLSLSPRRLKAMREILAANLSGYPDGRLKGQLEAGAAQKIQEGEPLS